MDKDPVRYAIKASLVEVFTQQFNDMQADGKRRGAFDLLRLCLWSPSPYKTYTTEVEPSWSRNVRPLDEEIRLFRNEEYRERWDPTFAKRNIRVTQGGFNFD